MSENTETLEAPNWLSELEKKREKRLKARLGHEAGAGAPCIKCEEKCPGLDLHFWRKICKNCRCSKEDHDVHDDDIYGWAQFQLLGSKPNRIKKKIVLPGKKDEVELEWAPKGNTETIDQYLKTLSPESLPVKGSQAAQARKQLLQKQIPIHDIDPTLCHELTDSELAKMQDYIKHMKSSAGVGQVIQYNLNYGNIHTMSEANAKFISNRYPKGIPSIETVQLLTETKSGTLTKQFEKLGIKDQQQLDAFFDKIPKPHNMTVHTENLGYATQNLTGNPENLGYVGQIPANSERNSQKLTYNYPESHHLTKPNPTFANPLEPNKKLGYVGQPQPPQALPAIAPSYEINQNLVNPRFAREHVLNHPNQEYVKSGAGPNYANQISNDPKFGYLNPGAGPDYTNQISNDPKLGYGNPGAGLDYTNQISNDPKLGYGNPGAGLDYTNQISNDPKLGYGNPNYTNQTANDPNFGYQGAGPDYSKEMASHPIYGHAKQGAVPNYGDISNDPNLGYGTGSFEINRNLPHYTPVKFNIHGEQQNPTSVGNVRDLAFGTHDLTNSNYNKPLQSYNPNQLNVSESQMVPNPVNIGAIRDIAYEYENPEIKSAIQGENKLFEDYEIGAKVPEDVEIQTKQCRKCGKFFEVGEFAIFVEKSDALYHSGCFKCAGCNQSLADLLYFYDKESDNIYCGRDLAKIRGIPRCKACDELIFVKEYCLAENSTFHLKHFCCFECDEALAGQNYVVEDSQPLCLPCYEKVKANKCTTCSRVIRPDEQGVALAEGIHFHTADECFCCSVCKKPLHGAKLLFRNRKLYCSHDCFRSVQ